MSSKKRRREASGNNNNSEHSPPRRRHKRNNVVAADEELAVNILALKNDFKLIFPFKESEMMDKINNLHQLMAEWNGLIRQNDINDFNASTLSELDLCLMQQITEVSLEALRISFTSLSSSESATDWFFEKLKQQKIAKRRQLEKEQQIKKREQIQHRRSLPITKDIWSPIERVNYFREGYQAAIKTVVSVSSNDHSSNTVTKKFHYIVCKIVAVNRHKQECTLVDVANADMRYTRPFSDVTPLPSLNIVSLSKRTVFKTGSRVLAVYPATTCFYAASIVKPPKSNQSQQTKYTLRFDDDGDHEKDIDAENIIPYLV